MLKKLDLSEANGVLQDLKDFKVPMDAWARRDDQESEAVAEVEADVVRRVRMEIGASQDPAGVAALVD